MNGRRYRRNDRQNGVDYDVNTRLAGLVRLCIDSVEVVAR